jgi:hypothetical protein
MSRLKKLLLLGFILVILSRGGAQGQALPMLHIIDAKSRTSDARLDRPVTFDADRMYLGELLEKVSAQTGVSVSMPAEDLGSGIPITCHLKNISLADFMNSVWSLVGFSKANWQITFESKQNTLSYQLLPTAASRALAERLQRESDEHTAHLFAVLLKMHTMTPKERQANAHQLAQALLMDNDADVKFYVEDSPTSARYWLMIGLFATELTPDQQAQLLKGEAIILPWNHLNGDTQAMLQVSAGHSYTVTNGVRTENEPNAVRFAYRRAGIGNKKHIARELSIGVGRASGFAGRSYMGVMELRLEALIYEGWILPGDLRHAEPEKQVVSALPVLPENTLWPHVAPLDLLLTQLADVQNVSYMGVLPDDANNRPEVSVGKSAGQCLDDLKNQASLLHKWRDGVLLFNYPVWFFGDDEQYPYALVKQLRESKQRNAGNPLTIPDIADAVITLNDVQMKRLAKEFPQIDNNKTKRAVFVFYKKYPEMLSEVGVAMDLNAVAMLKELKLMPALEEKDALERVRIIEKAHPQINDGRRLYRVQIQTAKQKEWQQIGDVSILPGRSALR